MTLERTALGGFLALCGVVVAMLLGGCGGGALRAHASTASIAIVAANGARRAINEGVDVAIAECAGNAACLERAERDWTAAAAAHDLVLPPLAAYRDAVLAAGAADADDERTLAALTTGLLRLVAEWAPMQRALAGLGIDVPTLGGEP